VTTREAAAAAGAVPYGAPRRTASTLLAAVLGFFVITLDAVIVNVALPHIRADLGGGIGGLQWVVDAYTLMFAALLLSSGSLADRIGGRNAFAIGLGLFVLASAACGAAPTMTVLVLARFVQGSAAALMMPASLSLIGQVYPDPARRARAIGIWAMGGAAASVSGPVLGGLLTEVSWRLVFLVNLPVGLVALLLLTRIPASAHHRVPFDWIGQVTAVLAMGALTYAAVEAGSAGITAPQVLGAGILAALAVTAFVLAQANGAHPMVPLALFRSPNVVLAVLIGFAFMVGYYGSPFVMSLYLQQVRGLTALGTGAVFLPMMLIGALLTPFTARLVERAGPRAVIVTGLALMAAGLLSLAVVPASAPTMAFGALMMLVGLGGPLVIPPVTAVLLNTVEHRQSGVASGVFHTSRQLGGALAVAVFGALLAQPETFVPGMRTSLVIAAVIAFATGTAALGLRAHHPQPA
jgi:MFS transporter, DHA2 family, methylenomycin A resistance protein